PGLRGEFLCIPAAGPTRRRVVLFGSRAVGQILRGRIRLFRRDCRRLGAARIHVAGTAGARPVTSLGQAQDSGRFSPATVAALESQTGTDHAAAMADAEATANVPARAPMLDEQLRDAARLVISPSGQADDDRLQAAFDLLRTHAPVYWVD